jgi:hypothetical protein
VGIAFLGKVFHQDRQTSHNRAVALWDKFSAIFPSEAPFSYPLVPVRDEPTGLRQQAHSLAQWLQPLPFEQMTAPSCIVEIRKYEDWPIVRDVVLHARDYIPQPFEPALGHSALGRLLAALARQRDICTVAITLRPQTLTDQETLFLYELFGWYQRADAGQITLKNPLIDRLHEINGDVFMTYLRTRASVGKKVYETLIHELGNLFLVRLHVVGFPSVQYDLVEALGSEMTADVDSRYPSLWTHIEPSPQEVRWAIFNVQWLEFARWGVSPPVRQAPILSRIGQLATVAEAMGAFRLPVASSGGLAGIEVRDEPFSLPTLVGVPRPGFSFGTLQDRGICTEVPFAFSQKIFTRLLFLLGDNGAPRHAVLQTFLGKVSELGLPWLLIRRADSTPAHALSGLNARHMRIGPFSGQAVIQPFFPPSGVSLPVFLDALQRVLTVVCQLEPVAALVLHQALVESYHASDEQKGLAGLVQQLKSVLKQIQAPPDLCATLEARVVLPLHDLACNSGTLFTVPPDASWQWKTPTIIEVDLVGSEISRTILYGCLWAYFTLALSQQTGIDMVRGLVGIEEPHALFRPLPSSATHLPHPTTSMAHALARDGVCTLLIEEQADLLDTSITNRTGATLVMQSSNEAAQKCAAEMIGASVRQHARMRLLHAQEVVVAVPGTSPVLINV